MNNGISALVMVTQLKSQNANQEAMDGAEKQRSLISEQKEVRAKMRTYDEIISDNVVTQDEYFQAQGLLRDLGLDTSRWDADWDGMLGNHSDEHGQWAATLDEGATGVQAENAKIAELTKKQFEDKLKDLDGEDQMGNFEIQDLMSRYNQAETLASSVQKKKDDTAGGIIQKVG